MAPIPCNEHENTSRLATRLRHFGLEGLLRTCTFDLLGNVGYFDVLRAMKLEPQHIDLRDLEKRPHFQRRFLTHSEIVRYAQDPQNNMNDTFIQQALGNSDQCFGVFDADTLASYTWYSTRPTFVTGEFCAHFSPQYVYMHHAFTHQNYRGKRLYSYGVSLAAAQIVKQGYRGLVSIVSAGNLESLRSVLRMGYRNFGNIYLLGRLGHYFVLFDKGCKSNHFWLETGRPGLNAHFLYLPEQIHKISQLLLAFPSSTKSRTFSTREQRQ